METPKTEFNKRLRAEREKLGQTQWRVHLTLADKKALLEHLDKTPANPGMVERLRRIRKELAGHLKRTR